MKLSELLLDWAEEAGMHDTDTAFAKWWRRGYAYKRRKFYERALTDTLQ